MLRWTTPGLLMLAGAGLAHAAEPPSEPILRVEVGHHTDRINAAATDAAARLLLTVSDDDTGRVWEGGRLLAVLRPPLEPGTGQLKAAAVTPDGERFLVAGATNPAWYGGGAIFVFGRDGRLLRVLVTVGPEVDGLALADGRWLVARTVDPSRPAHALEVFDLVQNRRTDVHPIEFGHPHVAAAGRSVAYPELTEHGGIIHLCELKDGRVACNAARASRPGWAFDPAPSFTDDGRTLLTPSRSYFGDVPYDPLGETLRLDVPGLAVRSTVREVYDFDKYQARRAAVPPVWDTRPTDWRMVGVPRVAGEGSAPEFSLTARAFVGEVPLTRAFGCYTQFASVEGARELLRREPGPNEIECNNLLAFANRTALLVGSGSDLVLVRLAEGQVWRTPVPSMPKRVSVSDDGQVVVGAFPDGVTRWFRLSDGREFLAMFHEAPGGRWVMWTPSGYYDASPGGDDLIGWQVNRGATQAADFFPAARFRARFYRPDVIDAALVSLDEATALRGTHADETPRLDRVLPPVIELVGPGEMASDRPAVTLRYRTRSAADAPILRVRARVAGQPVAQGRGLVRKLTDGVSELTVPVPAEDVVIQLFAESRYGVSLPATVQVRWTGPKDFAVRPRLYVLAVGVGRYSSAEVTRLELAAKDARDFSDALVAHGRLYRGVEVKLLTDGEATRDAVVDGLDWLEKQVTQHDVGMLFLAGHGLNDDAGNYYFLPADAELDKLKRSGVSMNDIRTTLANIAGKAVVFLDTCHAGNIFGSGRRGASDLGAVIGELASAENGVVVFSSSTGRQSSLEDPKWGNGAFTKAVIEGLSGAAAVDRTGRITHKMLDLYVSERVKALTGGRQSPVTQAPGGVPDFPLVALEP